jgi:ssDNA-binding Zn-finger/Zn-ribbon topoisomerase 1
MADVLCSICGKPLSAVESHFGKATHETCRSTASTLASPPLLAQPTSTGESTANIAVRPGTPAPAPTGAAAAGPRTGQVECPSCRRSVVPVWKVTRVNNRVEEGHACPKCGRPI